MATYECTCSGGKHVFFRLYTFMVRYDRQGRRAVAFPCLQIIDQAPASSQKVAPFLPLKSCVPKRCPTAQGRGAFRAETTCLWIVGGRKQMVASSSYVHE